MATTTTDIHTELVWSADAWEQFKAMKVRAGQIHAYYGELLGALAEASLLRCVTQVLASGPTHVYKDGDGLLFVTPHITMGCVFHEMSIAKLSRATGWPEDEIRPQIERTDSLRWPRAGEWSLHS